MPVFLSVTEWLNLSKCSSESSHSKTMRCIHDRNRKCHRMVKQLTKGSHKRCNTIKKPYLVKGELLNAYFKAEEFDGLEEYQVCSNMADSIKEAKVSVRKRAQSVVLDAEKRWSDCLMDHGSLKVDDIKKIVVAYTDDKGKKTQQSSFSGVRSTGKSRTSDVIPL